MHFIQKARNVITIRNYRESWFKGNPSELCSGGGRFESHPRYRLSWLKFFMVFRSPSRQVPGKCLKLNRDGIFPHPFQVVIHYHCIIRSYRTYIIYWQRQLNKLRINKRYSGWGNSFVLSVYVTIRWTYYVESYMCPAWSIVQTIQRTLVKFDVGDVRFMFVILCL
jgi:hypothetical protein